MLVLSRIVWILAGLAWAAHSLVTVAAHPDYWDPVTTLDFVSIWLYSAAWLLLALAVLLIGRLVSARPVGIAAAIVAAGMLVAGIANGIEDGLDVSWLGPVYVIGVLVGGFGLLGLAGTLSEARRPRLTWLSVVLFLGLLTFQLGGGLIILAALGSLAIAPDWYSATRPVADAAKEPAA